MISLQTSVREYAGRKSNGSWFRESPVEPITLDAGAPITGTLRYAAMLYMSTTARSQPKLNRRLIDMPVNWYFGHLSFLGKDKLHCIYGAAAKLYQ